MTINNDGQNEENQFGQLPHNSQPQNSGGYESNYPNFQNNTSDQNYGNANDQTVNNVYQNPVNNQGVSPQNFYGASGIFYDPGQYQGEPQHQFNPNYQIPNQYYYGQNQWAPHDPLYSQNNPNWQQSQVAGYTGYSPTHWTHAGLAQNYYSPTPNNPYPVIEPVAQPYNRFNIIWELLVTEASAFLPGITSAIVIGAQRLLNQNSTAIIQPLVTGHLALDIFLQVLVALFGTYAVFLIGYLLHRSGESFKAIGLTTKYTGIDIGLTVLLAFGAFVIAFALGFATTALHLQPTNNPAVSPNINHYYLIVGFADSLYTSFLEEVAVCGFLLHRLQQMNVKPIYAILISTALRCSYHVYGGWPLIAMTIPFGLMQAAVYQKTRSIKCQVGAHFIYDFVIFSLNIL